MSKAQTDIRTSSYDAATANAHGYRGTIEDALAQVRAEADVKPTINGRQELLGYLGALKLRSQLSGIQADTHLSAEYVFPTEWWDEDDTVVYGPAVDGRQISRYSLEYAMEKWPENFELPYNWGLPS
jgi:hypothetical protein